MHSTEKQNLVFIKLFTDENVNEKIKEACKKHNIKTAVVISGIGQLKNTQLGYFKKKNNYAPEKFDTPHELLSLNGNICLHDGDYLLHLHAVIGDQRKQTKGGHFLDGQVGVTAEIILLKTKLDIKRKTDKKTGLKTLFLEEMMSFTIPAISPTRNVMSDSIHEEISEKNMKSFRSMTLTLMLR